MTDLFLDFDRATRIEDWALHLQSGCRNGTLAYDHLNCASYPPVYI